MHWVMADGDQLRVGLSHFRWVLAKGAVVVLWNEKRIERIIWNYIMMNCSRPIPAFAMALLLVLALVPVAGATGFLPTRRPEMADESGQPVPLGRGANPLKVMVKTGAIQFNWVSFP